MGQEACLFAHSKTRVELSPASLGYFLLTIRVSLEGPWGQHQCFRDLQTYKQHENAVQETSPWLSFSPFLMSIQEVILSFSMHRSREEILYLGLALETPALGHSDFILLTLPLPLF